MDELALTGVHLFLSDYAWWVAAPVGIKSSVLMLDLAFFHGAVGSGSFHCSCPKGNKF
jgi:hypothetical protein